MEATLGLQIGPGGRAARAAATISCRLWNRVSDRSVAMATSMPPTTDRVPARASDGAAGMGTSPRVGLGNPAQAGIDSPIRGMSAGDGRS